MSKHFNSCFPHFLFPLGIAFLCQMRTLAPSTCTWQVIGKCKKLSLIGRLLLGQIGFVMPTTKLSRPISRTRCGKCNNGWLTAEESATEIMMVSFHRLRHIPACLFFHPFLWLAWCLPLWTIRLWILPSKSSLKIKYPSLGLLKSSKEQKKTMPSVVAKFTF